MTELEDIKKQFIVPVNEKKMRESLYFDIKELVRRKTRIVVDEGELIRVITPNSCDNTLKRKAVDVFNRLKVLREI